MFTAMGIDSGAELWQTRVAEWFSQRLEDPAYGIFVVLDEADAVVSCAVGAIRDAAPSPEVPDGRDVLISNICTVPAVRGQGHGRRAFDAVMDWARSTGIHRAELMATEDGRKMYERSGFAVTQCPSMRSLIAQTPTDRVADQTPIHTRDGSAGAELDR